MLRRLTLLVLLALLIVPVVNAQTDDEDDDSIHPTFPILDANGDNVTESGLPLSTAATCGSCHDTAFIEQHSGHANVGLQTLGADTSRGWEAGSGWFAGWNPITYRYIAPADARPDLTLAEWVQIYGWRHVGGGPANLNLDDYDFTGVTEDFATTIITPDGVEDWDWDASGGVEMNCFMCHTPDPDNGSRIAALEAGDFAWANTATLNGSGIVVPAEDGTWTYNEEAFRNGRLTRDYVNITAPSNLNCGQCHGIVDETTTRLVIDGTPLDTLTIDPYDFSQWHTLTTGEIFSPQRMNTSGVNLENKSQLGRSWDIHIERVVGCVDCHYALNNPVFSAESDESRPAHLIFDPRRLDFSEYLVRPLHQFANSSGSPTAFAVADRDCASCHDANATHEWLPYAERHTTAMTCTSCHTAEIKGAALEYIDWTVLHADSRPQMGFRGVDETGMITGYMPVLLPQTDDDTAQLAPYNIISAWYWVYDDAGYPVPLRDLQAAWFDGDVYVDAVLMAFDANADGDLSADELLIDTPEKEAVIAQRLQDIGLDNPRIAGEIQPYALNHNVAHGEWATRDCATCHSDDTRLTAGFILSDRTPGGTPPTFINADGSTLNGSLQTTDGTLFYIPVYDAAPTDFYVLGSSNVSWVDWFGILMFVGTLLGVSAHGGLRYMAAKRMPTPQEPEMREVYMYSVYERQWHWLQTVAISGLLFTGLVIHKPEMFSIFDFRAMVLIHNALAVVMVVNAALAAFYHLVSGEIQQFLPEPRGFFGKMFAQAKFYVWGIFRGEPHPFDKTPERKLNPLQQMTYLVLLNVLLPAQVITGVLMWGVSRWPEFTGALGGLAVLAPLHSLVAWALASFIALHVYLTTTGPTPMENIRAMLFGWEQVETHADGHADGATEAAD